MKRFYVNIRGNRAYGEDTEGLLLRDLASAINDAQLAARELVVEMARRGEAVDDQVVEICDEADVILANVWKSDNPSGLGATR